MSDQPDHTGSAMLALYPPPELTARLAVPGGLAPEEMHVTVAYVGDAADVDLVALLTAAAALLDRAPLDATISGHARFTGGEKDVVVALVDSPQLEALRRDTLDALREHAVPVPGGHGYCAHATLRYLDPDDPSPTDRLDAQPVRFDTLSVVHGQQRIDLPLRATTPPATAAAREAYAAGWARSGGPMTDRVKAGCTAAVSLAAAHPNEAGIFETALRLGSLEGTWAKVYQRRDKLIARQVAAANAAWKTVLTRDMLAAAVSDFRRRTGLAESDQSGGDDQARIAADAVAAAAAILKVLPDRPEWRALRTTIRDALAAGRAEGIVGAVAVAADRIERVGLDWDLGFTHAIAALDDLDTLWAQADGWLQRMLGQATADLGRALANAASSDATYAQMLADAMDALDSENVAAVSFIVDWATSTALSQGALALYASEGVGAVDWMTAGDGRVCPTCQDNEDNGPYAPGAFPECPGHPRCRCTPAASFSLANFDTWFTGP